MNPKWNFLFVSSYDIFLVTDFSVILFLIQVLLAKERVDLRTKFFVRIDCQENRSSSFFFILFLHLTLFLFNSKRK